ncbi:glycoside hydrolase family 31 protein [Cytophagales bacterium LB-30]|uniref:Glycoside hydrolase family 31 protein n=1 Tax=Shiella aurantiaca TaxID=3058365 RepID=A0ABT8F3V0_9BACT|nr:glycoside hydrolase family 31 protein [Shiella aurantiaca]MDN4165080.1 glycoside hydrolase family 31 protein [Shiella aurantiaca]
MQTQTKYSIKYYPGTINSVSQEGNFFYFYTEDTILELSVKTDRILRFRYAADGFFQKDFSYAVSKYASIHMTQLGFEEHAEHYEVHTAELICQIRKENLKITLLNKKHELILQDEAGFHWQHYLQKGGKINYCSKEIQPDEAFYGLGDKPTELNLRGKYLENYGTDTYGFPKDGDPLYKNIPFYMGLHSQGRQGYGIFFDNTFRTIFDFGKGDTDTASFWARGGEMNYYFIYGPDLLEVAEQYATLTGTPEMPPLWALGYHQCRWSYYPESKVKEITSEFRKRKIPCDAIYLDIDYMDGFRCFTWNKEYFPEPKRMVKELLGDGFKTVVIIDPGIKMDKDYWVWQQGIQKDYFCKRADGTLMEGDVWPGKCNFPDFTNPEVREWWSGLFRGLMETGVRGVWNDMNEPAVFEIGTFPEDVRHDYDGNPCSHRKAHNVYGMQMARATYHGVKRYMMPNRPFIITRSAYSGVQRYSSVWTGDNIATWEHLWIANVQCQRLSVSGISFAGSDVGGFIGEPDGELYTRWIQLATFHPFFRTHSSGNDTKTEQEPWSFGHKYETIVRKFINLRYQLLPYLYTAFWQYVKQGTPILRPLAYLDQNDPETHQRMDEFGYGEHILVCPVLEPGVSERNVYLPKGIWYHYEGGYVARGGQEVKVQCPLDKMPIFVKAGAVIPSFPKMQYVGESPIKEMTLHVYFQQDEEVVSTLYEDDGDNHGYKNGLYNLHKFETFGKKQDLIVTHHMENDKYESDYRQFKLVFHGVPFEAKEYIIDGKVYSLQKRNSLNNLVWIKADKHFKRIILR